MGYNRSGTRRNQRLRRHKKEAERLARKAGQKSQGQTAAATAQK
jgi:hypothetical protein